MNQPRCPICGELETHSPARCAGVPWDVFYTEAFMRQHRAMLAEHAAPPASYDASGDRGIVPVKAAEKPADASKLRAEDAWDVLERLTGSIDDPSLGFPTPAKDANVAHEAPPSGWRDRPPLL